MALLPQPTVGPTSNRVAADPRRRSRVKLSPALRQAVAGPTSSSSDPHRRSRLPPTLLDTAPRPRHHRIRAHRVHQRWISSPHDVFIGFSSSSPRSAADPLIRAPLALIRR
jgi:hypothetical protein